MSQGRVPAAIAPVYEGVVARVLSIEDETDLQEVIAYNLRQAGHDVAQATTAKEGLRLANASVPDVVLLDIMLPDMSGLEVCRTLKSGDRTRNVPVVMLTARSEEIDRVVGFELGADDYVTKPFSVRELLLRIRAILRRHGPEALPTSEVFAIGPLRVDVAAHRVWVDGAEVELTHLEFKLLQTLIERRPRVQSRSRLLEDVWTMNGDVATRTVDTHVKRLREKLGAAGELVETVRGVGYRFGGDGDD